MAQFDGADMERKIKIHQHTFRIMLSGEQILERVNELADSLYGRFGDGVPVFVGVLTGAIHFMSDLCRSYKGECECHFVKLSSYDGLESTGEVHHQLKLDIPIEGRDVVVVEDIIDSGVSMHYLLDYLKSLKPRSITICALFFKPDNFLYDYKIDHYLFPIANEFIVGYGLDYDQLGRNLKDIYVIDK